MKPGNFYVYIIETTNIYGSVAETTNIYMNGESPVCVWMVFPVGQTCWWNPGRGGSSLLETELCKSRLSPRHRNAMTARACLRTRPSRARVPPSRWRIPLVWPEPAGGGSHPKPSTPGTRGGGRAAASASRGARRRREGEYFVLWKSCVLLFLGTCEDYLHSLYILVLGFVPYFSVVKLYKDGWWLQCLCVCNPVIIL